MPELDFHFRQSPAHQAVNSWYESLGKTFFRQGDDFAMALDYSRRQWEWTDSMRKAVEDKADNLLKALLGALGVVIAILKSNNTEIHAWFILPFGLAALGALFCLAARHPVEMSEPMSVQDLLPLHQQHDDAGIRQASLAASYYVAAIGAKQILNNKAAWLDCASRTTFAAVVSAAITVWAV